MDNVVHAEWKPEAGEVVWFVGYSDDVPGGFLPGQILTVTHVYGPDSEWFGGVQAADIAGLVDFVWNWEVARTGPIGSGLRLLERKGG